MLEVVHHTPQAYFIASGFGEKSDWFQNIMHTQQVNIQVGRKKMSANAERLPFPQAKEILSDYAKAHPFALRELSRLIGTSYDGSEADLEKLATLLPIVKLNL